MGYLRGLTLCLVLVSLKVHGKEIVSRDEASTGEVTLGKEGSNREEKFLSIFQIVKFKNEACPADSGDTGLCYTEAECTLKGGVASGTCASSFGVCCGFTISANEGVVTEDNTYITNPEYPDPAATGMYTYSIQKCDDSIVQFRIEFIDVMLSGPAQGDCTNDTLMFSGFDAVSMKTVPMTLCGTLTGQHMYVSVKDVTDLSKIIFNIVGDAAKWKIKIDQISSSETALLAPRGCLTYHTEESGALTSFNNDGGNGELINNQAWAHCIMDMDGFCDVALTSSNFDLGAGDNIAFSSNCQTGSNLGTLGSLVWNFTGPYVVNTFSNDDNAAMNAGYEIDYMLLPC